MENLNSVDRFFLFTFMTYLTGLNNKNDTFFILSCFSISLLWLALVPAGASAVTTDAYVGLGFLTAFGFLTSFDPSIFPTGTCKEGLVVVSLVFSFCYYNAVWSCIQSEDGKRLFYCFVVT